MTTAEGITARKRPTGRRSGDSGTRDAILDAAKELFAELGYDGASIRAIATRAGVDPALIRHFFGDKETLFAHTVADRTAIPARMSAAFSDGDPAQRGIRVTDTYLRLWEDAETRPILHALIRSATTSERAAAMLREVLMARVLEGVAPGPFADGQLQLISLAASHLLGVAMARFVVRFPAIADRPHDDLVAEIAPTIQRYLSGTHR
ncbi:TetR family transcriptional regulator [Paenarthrobacter nitroguajacolicus]|uniref:TetR/AcrR family transcriptional regulator n=1 Tax=Paenarthrobacter nitroguajacolicus TaxID=211146 RepID=UPI00248BC33C|nr:TetR family transcriptional regulator [Paenarthrobacter nitroguajacolicus]MDI2037047.1 HTH-type transcriptional regulator BetI [Paenarthrobacter nitroguajacolicus]